MALSTTTNYSLRKHDAGDLNWDVDMNWNMTEIDKKLKLLFANFLTCSTAAGTTAKTVAFANFVLEAGCLIAVKFTNGNSASAPTLNVNSTGAKAIQYNGAAIPTNAIVANGVYLLAYDGTNWALLNPVTVSDAITEDETGLAPSQGTVFDALAFKLDSSDVAVTAAANKIPKADALGKIDPDYLPDARITFATTSTDNATSATNAPLKTAGGLAVAKSAWFGGPLKMVGLGTTASRWIGQIPPSTTATVTILSRSATNGARPAILTIYTSKGAPAGVCGVSKYIIDPRLTPVIAAQWGSSGSVGGYESVVLSVDENNLRATKADPSVGCCLELETLNNTNPWVSPSAEYFSV